MSTESQQVVMLCLSTTDSVLADEFTAGLAEQGLENTIHHVAPGAPTLEFLSKESAAEPHLILLDIREPNADACSFLAEVAQNRDTARPVVIVIADRDDEMAIVVQYESIVAGRISSTNSAEEFVALIGEALSSNWSFETIDETEPAATDD